MPYTIATSAGMIDALASNPLYLCPVWKIVSRDGLVAAYCVHSRPTVGRGFNPVSLFTFGGVTYKPAPVQSTRDMHKLGLTPNSTQLIGVFDDVITRADVEGGRWRLAKIVYEYVNYLDLSLGSTGKMVGIAGKWEVNDPYTVDFMSNASQLTQQIGETTSPTDRNSFPAGLKKSAWTTTRNVVSSADRRHLVIDGAVPADDYYQYGVLMFSTGDNSKTPGMEIKGNVGSTIELMLPMPDNIVAGNIVTLLAGYDGTKLQARDKFSDMENFDGEPDLPGMKQVFSYPE